MPYIQPNNETSKAPSTPRRRLYPSPPAPLIPAYRLTLHEPKPNTAAAEQHRANTVVPDVPPPGRTAAKPAPQIPTEMHLPAAEANPLPVPATAFGQLTVQQLLQSPNEAFSSVKEEVGLFIIRQFLAKSQDGATVLLKTGGQVNRF